MNVSTLGAGEGLGMAQAFLMLFALAESFPSPRPVVHPFCLLSHPRKDSLSVLYLFEQLLESTLHFPLHLPHTANMVKVGK